ncbi:MAG: hypothetical protein Q9218_008168 [Villophora microphyllina]
MNRLPQELITHVTSFIEREEDQSHIGFMQRKKLPSKLPPYATLSRTWQLAIETRTFRTLRLKSTELPYVTQLVTGHRRGIIANIQYEVVLPDYPDHHCAKFETDQDQERNNQAFTDAIQVLFQFLKTIEDHGVGQATRSVALDLCNIYSPMDRFHRGQEKLQEDEMQVALGKRYDLWEHRYEHSILKLLHHPKLPDLSILSRFRLTSMPYRHVEPQSAILIAAKCRNLQFLDIGLNDDEKKDPDVRRRVRYDLATALPTLPSSSLRDFTLGFYHEDPSNQYFSPPSALLPLPEAAHATDHLSHALHTLSLSTNLTSLILNPIVISPSLYWPSDTTGANPPYWPNLRHHHVEFNMTSPAGEWYFIRDPNRPIDEDEAANDSDDPEESASDTDSEPLSEDSLRPDSYTPRREARATGDYPIRSFRTLPDDALVNPLLLAMARAAEQMPRLQTMSLTSTMRDPEGAGFEVHFYGEGEHSHCDREAGGAQGARLNWAVGKWRPEEEILGKWREGKEGIKVEFWEL